MSNKTTNFLDPETTPSYFAFCDDRTGQIIDGTKRVSLVETVELMKTTVALLDSLEPKPSSYDVTMLTNRLCKHLGWHAYEIAVALHYGSLDATAPGAPLEDPFSSHTK